MARTVADLVRSVPPETEHVVRNAYRQTNRHIRDAIRHECRLQLRSGDSNPEVDAPGSPRMHEPLAPGGTRAARLRVDFLPGYPVSWHYIELPENEDFWLALTLRRYRRSLVQAVRGTEGLLDLKETVRTNSRLRSHPAVTKLQILEGSENVAWTRDHARNLLNWLDRFDPIDWIYQNAGWKHAPKEVLDDVLGVYRCEPSGTSDRKTPNPARIEVYWACVGLCASLLDRPTEALAIVVITHELAHAYTQLGSDIEGYRWRVEEFWKAERSLIEGLAQYYTERVLTRLASRGAPFAEALETFTSLLQHQSVEYTHYQDWTDHPSSASDADQEAVRTAMLEARRTDKGTLSEFKKRLAEARRRLG